jgi:RNA polymerase sigma-B factor
MFRLAIVGVQIGTRVQLRGRVISHQRHGRGFVVATSPFEYADVAEMFRRLQSLDGGSVVFRRQREAIIERTLPLADHIARRFRNRGEPLDDLVQTARVGLVNAVNRFDVGSGCDFLAFAVPTITGEVRRHFRDYGWAVKVPRRLKELQSQLNRARAELSQQLGRAPTATEVANHLGIDRESVIEATIASSNYTTLSTDMQFDRSDEHHTLAETFGAIDDNFDKVLDVHTVRPLMAALPEREQIVLALRFFDNMTQTEIANRIGCSQMHVSRLLAQALRTLRRQIHEPAAAAREPELASTA